jgi:hypothetical protein
MTIQEAKRVLQSYRPGGQDRHDESFSEALALAAVEPELQAWFAEQQAFDEAIAAEMKNVFAPAALKESLLAERKIIRLPWWKAPAYRVAAAAAVVLAAGVALWFGIARFKDYDDFRNEIISAGFDHGGIEGLDAAAAERWVAEAANDDFQVPTALRDLPVIGGGSLDWKGRKVSIVCFHEGNKHVHLFVLHGRSVHGGPDDRPEFAQCGAWKTASWRQGDKTYMLVSMNYQTFLKRFRKAGHWLTG